MKRVCLTLMTGVLILAGCSRVIDNKEVKSSPFLPVSQERSLPKIPPKELKVSVLELQAKEKETENSDGLLKTLNQDVTNPSITKEDLDRGWYLGQKYEKRYATPENWVWLNRGEQSVWMRPGAPLENPFEKDAGLCDATGGYYQYSCYDYQMPRCKYVGKSKCGCRKGTRWLDEQGCLLLNDVDDFVTITSDELKQGWYSGQQDQKKKDTPYGWQWLDQGVNSRWQNTPSS
ncbi:hypothetical protein HZA43_05405 [Candidatus Peregrinibacteria bacterium]|nr:hypothetical protein [Candidatus Peregrinibacteria bacterium]